MEGGPAIRRTFSVHLSVLEGLEGRDDNLHRYDLTWNDLVSSKAIL